MQPEAVDTAGTPHEGRRMKRMKDIPTILLPALLLSGMMRLKLNITRPEREFIPEG